jgi:yecA family protein
MQNNTQNTTQTPSYNNIAEALETLNIHHSASELYGLLCALFCASAQLTEQAWINGLISQEIEKTEITDKAQKTLINFFNWTNLYINTYIDDNKSEPFFILLPDSKQEFNHTLIELVIFSQGFLSGLNLAHINSNTQKDPQIIEALDALTQISCLDDQEEKDTKSNQENLKICTNYTQEAVHNIINKLKIPNKSELKN